VTFDIDADGILHVSAQDKATGRAQSITITASSGLSKDEVNRMVQDAERHRQEDESRKDEVEARNSADSIAYQAEKLLREQGDKVPGDLKSEVQEKIAACRSAMQGEDLSQIRATTEALSAALQKIGAAMYQQPGEAPPEGEEPPQPPDDDEDVVEGEFSEA
jgi:molecular chaperone DnaK